MYWLERYIQNQNDDDRIYVWKEANNEDEEK